MRAMILAAGLGTRLRPLTDNRPKALIPVTNKPIITRAVEYLKKHGISRIVVNAHHHHEQIVDYLDGGRPFGLDIDVRVEPKILGTGGGIKNVSDFWGDEPFIVINSDILTNIDLSPAYEHHLTSGSLATLILHDREPFNQIRTDNNQNITDIAKKNIPGRLAFTGIHIMDPGLLSHIPEGKFFDIIDCYR
ncbi:MAG: nucleotidyltransferase family protein, partial [Thermodesulfobacteriota bacterium]|nr:nucleotidyltransferase family protein [Thermodesulfobacteriota bacterium]